MQLNSAALNTRSFNAAARTAVYAAAELISGFDATLDGLRTTRGWADFPVEVYGDGYGTMYRSVRGEAHAQLTGIFNPTAFRLGAGNLQIGVGSELDQTVSRSGRGTAYTSLRSDLFYSRTQYGFGSASVTLEARAEVGVVFIDGVMVIAPMTAELGGTRARHAGATAYLAVDAEFLPSAVRRDALQAAPTAIMGALDPSHITDAGVRYVGMYGDAPHELIAKNDGIRGVTNFGEVNVGLSSAGYGRRIRTTNGGNGLASVLASGDFRVRKFFGASPEVVLDAALSGEIYTRGAGSAMIPVTLAGNWNKTTHVKLDGFLTSLLASGSAIRYRGAKGLPAGTTINTSLPGEVYVRGTGSAVTSFTTTLALMATRKTIVPSVVTRGTLNSWSLNGARMLGPNAQPRSYASAITTASSLNADIHVRGTGTAEAKLVSALPGQVARHIEGVAGTALASSLNGAIYVRASGVAETTLISALDGLVYVRGEGTAATPLNAELAAEIFVRGSGTAVAPLNAELAGDVFVRGEGTVETSATAQLAGLRITFGDADAMIEVLGPASGYVNIFNEDDDVQVFFRPFAQREHTKPAIQREWGRA